MKNYTSKARHKLNKAEKEGERTSIKSREMSRHRLNKLTQNLVRRGARCLHHRLL